MVSPSRCPPWQPERPGPTRREPRRAQRSYTTRRDTIKLEAGAFDEDVEAAGLLQEFEAKISALERLVGRQALEIEFLKGALKSAPRPRSATTSVIAGPVGSPSREDVV